MSFQAYKISFLGRGWEEKIEFLFLLCIIHAFCIINKQEKLYLPKLLLYKCRTNFVKFFSLSCIFDLHSSKKNCSFCSLLDTAFCIGTLNCMVCSIILESFDKDIKHYLKPSESELKHLFIIIFFAFQNCCYHMRIFRSVGDQVII